MKQIEKVNNVVIAKLQSEICEHTEKIRINEAEQHKLSEEHKVYIRQEQIKAEIALVYTDEELEVLYSACVDKLLTKRQHIIDDSEIKANIYIQRNMAKLDQFIISQLIIYLQHMALIPFICFEYMGVQ